MSRGAAVAETGARLYGRTASRPPGRFFYFFTDDHHGTTQVVYDAFRIERREGMLIERGDEVYGGAATFDWDLGLGTARVEPPPPFSGRGFYRRDAGGGQARWTGSLRAPVLGGPPMRLTGAAFGTRLAKGSPFD